MLLRSKPSCYPTLHGRRRHFFFVSGYVLGTCGQTPPSGKLNIAAVGIGGMSRNTI